jgi:hypothetical protein
MHQPSLVDIDMRLLGRLRTYKLETIDLINSPIASILSTALSNIQVALFRLILPLLPMSICRGSMSVRALPFPCSFVHPYPIVSIGNYPNSPAVKYRHPPFPSNLKEPIIDIARGLVCLGKGASCPHHIWRSSPVAAGEKVFARLSGPNRR